MILNRNYWGGASEGLRVAADCERMPGRPLVHL